MSKTSIQVTTNAFGVSMDIAKTAKQAPAFIGKVVEKNGEELLFLVKLGATGWKGGPEVITGRYNNSIRKEVDRSGGVTTVTVGTDEPYGLKLEVGGLVNGPQGDIRTIAPHPHFSTAIDYLEPDFMEDLLKAIDRLPIGGRGKM